METVQNQKIRLNIFSTKIEIESNSPDLLERLKKDFSHFLGYSPGKGKGPLSFKASLQDIPWEKVPFMTAKRQGHNCITYESGGVRYNDYYGEALSIYSFKTQEAQIFSPNLDRLHEITYLLGLSRSGKRMDLKGLHKIHAMGVSNGNFNFIVMMPMKGGKSTMLMELLKRKNYSLISDDSPVIGRRGQIFPFPLRIGLENIPAHGYDHFDRSQIYQIKRMQFGTKTLVPIKALQNPVTQQVAKRTVLCFGIRSSGHGCKITKVPRWRMVRPLMANMVVGIGLPMILEYFLETGIKDFFRNTFIILSRFWSAMALLLRSDTYFLYLGKDLRKNMSEIETFLQTL